MANPKWLMKPLDIYETDFGFRGSGEGVIYKYEKSKHKYGEPEIHYFVLTMNKTTQRNFLLFYSRHMSMQSIRRNIEIRQEFSKYFKRDLLELIFGDKPNLSSIKRVVDIIRKL